MYRVVYGKSQPCSRFVDRLDEACALAEIYRDRGYVVDIWKQGQNGAILLREHSDFLRPSCDDKDYFI